MNNSPEF